MGLNGLLQLGLIKCQSCNFIEMHLTHSNVCYWHNARTQQASQSHTHIAALGCQLGCPQLALHVAKLPCSLLLRGQLGTTGSGLVHGYGTDQAGYGGVWARSGGVWAGLGGGGQSAHLLVGILALQGLELSLCHLGSHTEYLQIDAKRVSETKTTDMHTRQTTDESTQVIDKNATE